MPNQQLPIVKRILIGFIIIIPVFSGAIWGINSFASAFFRDIPNDMRKQCVGLGAGDTVMRPYNVSLDQVATFIKSNKLYVNSTGKKIDLAWTHEGDDSYTLAITSKDSLAGSQSLENISFQLVDGKANLVNCGPNTLAFQRDIIEGQDVTDQGSENFIALLLMASHSSEAAPTT